MKSPKVQQLRGGERQGRIGPPQGILHVGARLAADPERRRRLEADPRAALVELGAPVPEHVEFRVVSNTGDTFHLAMPPDPNADLSDSELHNVAGGSGTASSGSSIGSASSFPSCLSSVGSVGTAGSASSNG